MNYRANVHIEKGIVPKNRVLNTLTHIYNRNVKR